VASSKRIRGATAALMGELRRDWARREKYDAIVVA